MPVWRHCTVHLFNTASWIAHTVDLSDLVLRLLTHIFRVERLRLFNYSFGIVLKYSLLLVKDFLGIIKRRSCWSMSSHSRSFSRLHRSLKCLQMLFIAVHASQKVVRQALLKRDRRFGH